MRPLRFLIAISHGFKTCHTTKNLVFRLRRYHTHIFYTQQLDALDIVRDVFRPDMAIGVIYDVEDVVTLTEQMTTHHIKTLIVPIRARSFLKTASMLNAYQPYLGVMDIGMNTDKILTRAYDMVSDLQDDLSWLSQSR